MVIKNWKGWPKDRIALGPPSVAADKVALSVGQEVSILKGPFAGHVGVVDEVLDDGRKARISLEISGVPTQVEVQREDIQPQ